MMNNNDPGSNSIGTMVAEETLFYKPDWAQAKKRWTATWDLNNNDRPLLRVYAPRVANPPPRPVPPSFEAMYYDPDFVASNWEWRLENEVSFLGEAVPTAHAIGGVMALGLGTKAILSDTVWIPQLMKSIDDPLGYVPGADDESSRKLEAVVRRILAMAPGRFLVGTVVPCHANDELALLRDTNDFLLDLADNMKRCVERLDEMIELCCQTVDYFRRMTETQQAGCTYAWTGLWREEFFNLSQSDVSCMLSAEMFKEYSIHELNVLNDRGLYPILYHVCGPRAFRHIPALLALPFMRVIQMSPGVNAEPHGPAWLDHYRQVQASGRGLDLSAPWENVEFLIRHLKPEGVMLATHAPSMEAGEELIHKAAKWAGSDYKI